MEELLRSPGCSVLSLFYHGTHPPDPPAPGPPGTSPRTLIFWLLNCWDWDEVLQAARRAGELKHQNTRLLFFPDYSVETQKRRRSFDQIKVAFRAQNIRYSILFPAKLRIQDGFFPVMLPSGWNPCHLTADCPLFLHFTSYNHPLIVGPVVVLLRRGVFWISNAPATTLEYILSQLYLLQPCSTG